MAGRPPKYNSPEEMQMVIDDYFGDCEAKEIPPTVAGLAYALNLSRQGILEYGNKEAYSDTIKRAKTRIEAAIEQGLLKGLNATGCIFNLKNNFGWKDQQDVKHSGGFNVNMPNDDADTL